MQFHAVALLALAAGALAAPEKRQAYNTGVSNITSTAVGSTLAPFPTANSTIAKGSEVTVDWTSVDTDATTFSIFLVNFVEFPPVVMSLVQNVPQDLGTIDVTIPCAIDSGSGWQINFINGTNTYVIYAQSAAFTLTGNCVDATTASATPTPQVITNTTTATVTTTIIKTVQSIAFPTSAMVWYVTPSAAASCAPGTITVYASGPIATPNPGTYGNYSLPGAKSSSSSAVATGVIVPVAAPTTTGSPTTAAFTGAASMNKVGGAAALLIGGAFAILL